jgi:hypothetical protein
MRIEEAKKKNNKKREKQIEKEKEIEREEKNSFIPLLCR